MSVVAVGASACTTFTAATDKRRGIAPAMPAKSQVASMKRGVQRAFAKRVQVALGWCILIGLTASINFIPSTQQSGVPLPGAETTELHQSAVFPPSGVPADVSAMPSHQRVVAWFARYDQIRRRAKMSPAERALAFRLWASSFVVTSEVDKQEGKALLASMVQRYDTALKELSALPQIPETKTLHQGYLTFFSQAKSNFEQYLQAFNEKPAKDAIAQMAAGRRQLAVIDARNKSLDRRLRKHHRIPEFS